MPQTQRNELKAGVLTLVALGVIAGVVLWLGAADMFKPVKSRVVFFADQAGGSVGLAVGDTIQLGDVPIGRISEVRYSPEKKGTLYMAEIEREDIRIYDNGKAYVSVQFVGASSLVVTTLGTEDRPLADVDHPIVIVGTLDQAVGDIAAAAADLKKITATIQREMDASEATALLSRIHGVVGDIEKAATNVATISADLRGELDAKRPDSVLAKVRRSVADVNKITGDISRQTDPKVDGSLMAKAHGALDTVGTITTDARPRVKKMLADLTDITGQIRAYSKEDLREILTKFRQTSTEILKISKDFAVVSGQAKEIVVFNRDNIDRVIDNLALLSADLKAVGKEVRRHPWKLLRRPRKEEVHAEGIASAARAFSSGAAELDQALGRLVALSKAKDAGIPVDDPQLLKIRKQLDEVFAKFNAAEQALWEEMEK